MPKKKKPVARKPRVEVESVHPKAVVAEVMRAANAKANAQYIKPPLTWMDAEALIEAEMKRVSESHDWSTRQQEAGFQRALLLLRRHRRSR